MQNDENKMLAAFIIEQKVQEHVTLKSQVVNAWIFPKVRSLGALQVGPKEAAADLLAVRMIIFAQ